MRVKSSRHPEEPAAEAAHLITRLAIALLLIVAPIASVGTRRAIYVLVPIGVALTLVAWLLEPGGRGPRQLRDALFSSTGLLVIFLGLFAALSLIWTPFGQGPSERYVKSASTFVLAAAAAALLPERTKTSNLYLLPIGVAAGAIAVVAIALFAPGIAGRPNDPQVSLIARSAFGIALLVWPALGALRIRRKTRAAIALAAATVIAELAARVPLALVATAIGALVFAAALSRPNVAGRWTALVGAALFFVAPVAALFAYLVFPFGIGGGVVLPLQTWGSFIVTDGLRFLLGHGFDSAELGVIANYLPSSTPRSALFEAWFELGIVGAGATALLWAQIARRAGRASPVLAPFVLGGLSSAYVLCAFGLGVAPIWWVTLLALAGFAFAILHHGQPRAQRPGVGRIPAGE